jgi:hypothetical protein
MMASKANFDAWQAFYAAGLSPGRPGREHFQSTNPTTASHQEQS